MEECLHTQIGRAHVHACTRDARTHARVRGWCCACYVGLRPRHARKIGVSPHLIDKYIRCETDDLAHFVLSRLPATPVNGAPSLAGRSLGFLYWYNKTFRTAKTKTCSLIGEHVLPKIRQISQSVQILYLSILVRIELAE